MNYWSIQGLKNISTRFPCFLCIVKFGIKRENQQKKSELPRWTKRIFDQNVNFKSAKSKESEKLTILESKVLGSLFAITITIYNNFLNLSLSWAVVIDRNVDRKKDSSFASTFDWDYLYPEMRELLRLDIATWRKISHRVYIICCCHYPIYKYLQRLIGVIVIFQSHLSCNTRREFYHIFFTFKIKVLYHVKFRKRSNKI